MSDPTLIKLFRPEEWAQFERDGVFHGSPDDVRDGFIHLSTAEQAPGTLARHFAGVDGVVHARVTLDATLEPHLRWETAKNGEDYPHLFAPLPLSCVERVDP